MLLRDRQDEAMGVIIRLLSGEERFSYESDWFTLHDAALQILPMQERMPMATASSISPSGMQIAGKYGIGVLSIASTSAEGLQALPTQWAFAEEAAASHGTTVDRARLAGADELAHRRDQGAGPARGRARPAPLAQRVQRARARPPGRHPRRGPVGAARPGRPRAAPKVAAPRSSARPTTRSQAIRNLQEVTGGFGVVLGFAHDWANRENARRSWDMVARYVIPAINGSVRPMQASADYVEANKAELMGGASAAVMSKIMAHEGAAAAMATTMAQMAERAAARKAKNEGPDNDPAFRPGAGLPNPQ